MLRRFKGWIVRKLQGQLRVVTQPVLAELVPPQVARAMQPALDGMASVQAGMRSMLDASTANTARMQALVPELQALIPALQAQHDAQLGALNTLHAEQLRALARDALAQLETFSSVQARLERQVAFTASFPALLQQLQRDQASFREGMVPPFEVPGAVRAIVRKHAGLPVEPPVDAPPSDSLAELRFIWNNSALVQQMLALDQRKRVLYAGQSYYNAWYLSRALRERGWVADVLNWDDNPASQIYYHGEDFRFQGSSPESVAAQLRFYTAALYKYRVVHFSNAHGISFGGVLAHVVGEAIGPQAEIHLVKALGRKISYSNNGCLDGVSQTAFSRWGPESVCAICRWRNEPAVCSDELNLKWGRFRNSIADYQCTLGGNRADYNDDPRVHEAPGFYCVDPDVWHPGLEVPEQFRLPRNSERTIRLYHAVGNRDLRTTSDGVNIKSSHVYLPLIEKLRSEGWDIELLEPQGVPNREVRFLQLQADIFLEMLTFGWFGANAREAMMLGKPVVCFIRPEWLESLREEQPGYAEDLPIVSATPDTVEQVLLDLMRHPDKRAELGRRGREFMLRWHSPRAGAAAFDDIYSRLLRGDPVLRQPRAAAPSSVTGQGRGGGTT